ncbi:hypothetical protein ACPDHJ_05890 [Myroides sp. C8-3]|uniref:hypothetical protein n=1 Tax=Myroides sp. C8-3 TaxID=3400533 RepID=UPI003D2F7C8D
MKTKIEAPCNDESEIKSGYSTLKIGVSYDHDSTPERFTHFRIQDAKLTDIINFTLSQSQSDQLNTFFSNQKNEITPLTLEKGLQNRIVVYKEKESTYTIHVSSIKQDGEIFESSYTFQIPFLDN